MDHRKVMAFCRNFMSFQQKEANDLRGGHFGSASSLSRNSDKSPGNELLAFLTSKVILVKKLRAMKKHGRNCRTSAVEERR